MADEHKGIISGDMYMTAQIPYSDADWPKFIERIKSGELVVFQRVKKLPPVPDGPNRIYGEVLGDDRI